MVFRTQEDRRGEIALERLCDGGGSEKQIRRDKNAGNKRVGSAGTFGLRGNRKQDIERPPRHLGCSHNRGAKVNIQLKRGTGKGNFTCPRGGGQRRVKRGK